MKILFLMFHDSVLRYLIPKLISLDFETYAADTTNFSKIIKNTDLDFIIADIDNCNFDVLDVVNKFSTKKSMKWIFYTYHYDEKFIEILKHSEVKGILSKNIHPEYLLYKIQSILFNREDNFVKLRRKFYRANIEPDDNTKVTLYLPTIKNPIICRATEISILGMHIVLKSSSDIVLFREGLYLSKIYLTLEGHRLLLSGKIIRQSSENGLVILFDKMDNYVHDKIAKYIYKSIDKYLKKLKNKDKVKV